jgi:hypothetical protein
LAVKRRIELYPRHSAVALYDVEAQMRPGIAAALGLMLTLTVLPLLAAPADSSRPIREIACYVVMQEGKSSEGNALYLKKMGVDPEAVKTFAPLRFTREGGKFTTTVQGAFAYQAESPTMVDRSGKVALYEIPLRLKADPPPKAEKTVKVTVSLSELSGAGGLVQPSIKAMDKAAAAQKMSSGTAWIIEMSRAGKGKLKATVGLAK